MIEEVAIEVKTTMVSPTLSDVFTAWKEQTQHSKSIPNDTLAVIPTTAEAIVIPDTEEPVAGELADTEAQAVIRAVEPILKKCKKRKMIKPKTINLFRDQQLNVKLENGITLSLNFAIPEN